MKAIRSRVQWVLNGRSSTAATLQTVMARILILAANMGTGIITSRALEPQGRGEYNAIALWPQFLAYLLMLGLPAAIQYNFKRHPEKKSELFSAALGLSVVLGLFAMTIGVAFMPRFLPQYSADVIRFAQWYMILAPIVLLTEIFFSILEANQEFTFVNQLRSLQPLFTLAILGVLALTEQLTPLTAALAYSVPGLPLFLWMWRYLWQRFRPRWKGLGSAYQLLVSYGIRAYGMNLLGTLAEKIDQALVVTMLSPASMGLYTLALSVSRMLGLFHSSTITVLLPKIAARPIEEVVALTGRAVRVSTAVTTVVALAVAIPIPFLIQLLYGDKFVEAVGVFRILSAEITIGGAAWVLAQTFMAVGRPGALTVVEAISVLVTVPLLLILIPIYGLEGAGWSLFISTIFRLVCLLVGYPLLLKVPPPGLIATRKDIDFLRQVFFHQ
ncbi:oligosaccharide flippase family protein [Chroococcidiopsis sp. FACHB-1243]|uniref:lipopolysaccharide biosynthesis protein n=1 Tax=Chroococcidiopsis sp. [FACHB-1243] TaxID=2692781 RepID=UPI00177AC90B|nr:oligosaccharide flippase family protein [Chroococcidiopsis sp. [FACHB-1243]]MBD2306537.1 oligosaccharide flippase family protein [Chroococcidiopsis sp. [FACHB-1243]]